MESNRLKLTKDSRLMLTMYSQSHCIANMYQAAEPKHSVIFYHFLNVILSTVSYLYSFMTQSLNLAPKHISAFNLKMCKMCSEV